jgi:hypothetical protein
MQYTLATPQKLCWRLSDGWQVDLGIGDEIEIDTGMPLIPHHRGLIYGVEDGTPLQVKIIHNNKGPGVGVLSWNDFSRGREVRLLRRPSSPEHASAIWARAHANIGHAYHPLNNCEHFTDFCYTGQGESPTLQKWVLGVAVLVLIAAVGNGSDWSA